MSTSRLQVYRLIHYFTRIYYSMIRSVDQFACQQPVGLSVVYLWVSLSVCLSVDACFYLCIIICACVSICVCLSIGLSVGGLSGDRSVYTVCLPFSRSVCLWSICLCACLRASACLYLSVYLSFSLFVCLLSVGRSVVSLSELMVSHSVHEACRQRGGGC